MLKVKIIKGKTHYLYSSIENYEHERNKKDVKLQNWRFGSTGEWVLTDDNCVVQILKCGIINKKEKYIRAITGSYLVSGKKEMYGTIPENIYTFSGTNEYKRFLKKNDSTSKECIFAQYVAIGSDPVDAYLKTYSTNNRKYASVQVGRLLKTTRMKTMIKEEIKKVLDDENVSPNYIIRRFKQVCEQAEKDGDVLRGLESLAKISGLFENNQEKQQQLTVWSGFTPEQLAGVKGEQVLLHGEVSENE
jgi:hypothetical protein